MPHEQEMLDDPQDPEVRETFWMLASQAGGKTFCLIFLCQFVISVLKKSLIMVRDTKDRALEWMRDKFEPTTFVNPKMAGLMVEPRKSQSKSTSLSRRFPGGVFKLIGAKSRGAFRSTSCGFIFQDEIDAYEIIKEGDPCALADRAAITFTDAWKIKSSTPTIEGLSRINAGFLRGDQKFYFLPCHHCGEFQWLKDEQLKFSFKKDEYDRFLIACNPGDYTWEIGNFPIVDTRQAIYVCEHCRHGWTDAQRIQAYLSGHKDNPPVMVNGKELRAQWRATAPFKGIRSRHMSGMYLTIGLEKGFKNYLHQFAENFLTAKRGGRETLMTWTNMFKCMPFSEPGEKVEWLDIKNRAEDYGPELPVEVVWIAFGADVHPDRVEILIYGWGDGQEAWALERKQFFGDFDMPAMQERVKEYLVNKRFTHPILGELHINAGLMDSGFQTKVRAVYRFCGQSKWSTPQVWASKGVAELGGAVFSRKTEKRFGGLFFLLNTDYLKSLVFDRIKKTEPGPRYIHFPKEEIEHEGQKIKTGFDESFYRQLCSERRIIDPKTRKAKWVKHTSATRNEALDDTVGAFGAFEIARQDEWIARKWREVQQNIKEKQAPRVSDGHEVILNQPAEAKIPELKQESGRRVGTVATPRRRVVRVASPFARRF